MVTLNKPSAGDTDWTTEINDNWSSIESALNGQVTKVVPTSPEDSRTSDPTPTDDSYLQFAIGANETWQFEIDVFLSCTSATPDVRFAFGGPSGMTFRSLLVPFQANLSGILESEVEMFTSTSPAIEIDWTSAPNPSYFSIRGSIFNGANAGTFSFQWSQRNSNATKVVILPGSYLIARKA